MKTKTEAVKVLLEAGWSWDEVREVLKLERENLRADSSTAVVYKPWAYEDSYVTNT